jgi:hypothetical protein
LEEGPATLFIRARGYQRLALRPEERAHYCVLGGRLLVPLEKAALVRGVLQRDGRTQAGAAVSVYRLPPPSSPPEGAQREFQGTVTTDPQGEFRWDDLAPGAYLLEALRITDATANTGVRMRRRVELKRGEELAVVLGDDLGDVSFRGRCLDRRGEAVRGASLILTPEFPWSYEEFAADFPDSARGRFHVPSLRPGRYAVRVEFEARESGSRTITLPSFELTTDTERDIELPPAGE